MRPALFWVTGLLLSLALHAGLILVLPIWLAPEPIDDMPRPQSELRIETQEVARSESSAIPPPSEAVAQEQTVGSELGQQEIPESRASAEVPEATALAEATPPPPTTATAPETAPVRASTATVSAVQASITDAAPVRASVPAAAPIPASATVAAPVPATTLPTAAVRAELPQTAPVTAAALPTEAAVIAAPLTEAATKASDLNAALIEVSADVPSTPALAAAAPVGDVAPDQTAGAGVTVPQAAPIGDVAPDQTAGAGVAVPQAAPDPMAVPPGALNADRVTAELAWSGGADSQIHPQALATIQSFMEPGDIGSQSYEARDALTALLSQVPCSRLQAEFDPLTGSIVLRGHVPEEGLREPVLAALKAQVGQGLPVVDEMLILGRPQCSALSGIGEVGLPQSTDQNTDDRLIGPGAQAAVFNYRGGQTLRFGMQAPDYDSYVYVDYFDAGGNVFHIVPNEAVPLELSEAKSELVFQAVGPNGQEIQIGPPYGQEIAVAFAASEPLFDEVRPIVEPAEPYLEWLRDRVAAARAADPRFKGEWVYFFVATSAE